MMERVLRPKHVDSIETLPDGEKQKRTSEEAAALADPEKQAEYRREYLAQLRRRACPGCGESGEPF